MTKKEMYRQILEHEGYKPLSGDVNTSFGIWVNPNAKGRKRYAHLSSEGELTYSATNPKLKWSGLNRKKEEKTMENTVTLTEKQLSELVAKAVKDAMTKGTDNGKNTKAKAKAEKAVQAKPEKPWVDLSEAPLAVLGMDEDYTEMAPKAEGEDIPNNQKVEFVKGKKSELSRKKLAIRVYNGEFVVTRAVKPFTKRELYRVQF